MAYALTSARVFIGDGRVLDSATVLVEDERITKVAGGEFQIPAGYTTIDLSGHTLCPGFIDCHVHLILPGTPNPLKDIKEANQYHSAWKAAQLAEQTLMGGFTSVRDMGGMDGMDLALRDAIAQGLIPGPRVLASGRAVVITGGHGWPMSREADGPHDFRKAAREQLKAGADQIKLMATGGVMTVGVEPGSAQATEEELRAAIEEAHKAGRKTATHAQGTEGILNALRAGIDSIEHGFHLNDEAIELMLKNGTALVPTLAALHFILENGVEAGILEVFVEKARRSTEAHKKSLMMAKEAGVLIGMGTDAGTPFNMHGKNACEMALMVKTGFSPAEALSAATLSAAKVLGTEQNLGSIEAGKLADLVAVKGDPLQDINLVTDRANLSLIMKGGELVKG